MMEKSREGRLVHVIGVFFIVGCCVAMAVFTDMPKIMLIVFAFMITRPLIKEHFKFYGEK